MYISSYYINCFVERINSFIKPIKLTAEWVKNIFKEDYKDKDVVLFLTAAHNPIWGLSFHPFITHKLKRSGKVKLVKKTVSGVADLHKEIAELKKQGANIRGLWINSHANCNAILLGKGEDFTGDNWISNHPAIKCEKKIALAKPLKKAFSKLDKDAFIVLNGCEIARVTPEGPSIAQTVASLAPGRTVFASTRPINVYSTTFRWIKKDDNNYEGDVTFMSPKLSLRNGIVKLVTNIFYAYCSTLHVNRINSTARFREEPLQV
jgi:hypothetical protein